MMMRRLPEAAGARRARSVSLVLAGVCVLNVTGALADVELSPLATASVLHNSNVFARPTDEPPFANLGNTRLGDTIERYLVGATADFNWGLDKLSLNAQGSRFEFNRFTELDHYESKFGGVLDWHLGAITAGDVSYTQSRLMAPLADTLSDQLEIQTERLVKGVVRVLVTPQWRFDVNPSWHEFESPLPAYPEFGFKEAGVAGSINYVGIEKLTAGLREDYLDGAYHHIVAATQYHQNTTGLTASYAVTNFSAFDAQAGYTQRRSSLVNPDDALSAGVGAGGFVGTTSSFTGALGLRRQLSVKTSVNLRVFREVDSYVAGANSEIGTGGEAGVRWDPDVKLSFTARYRITRQTIEGALVIADFQNRTDRSQHAELGADYHALHWLTFHPYALYDKRTSNFHDANFNATVFGIDVTAQLNPPTP